MKKGLLFTIEALFLVILLTSTILIQQNQTNQKQYFEELDIKISNEIYTTNQIDTPNSIELDNTYCKDYPIYDFDENKIIIKKYCE